ncbi:MULTISPECIES: hypothetical protein [unclassified Paraburkholderia]|uniref:hypothetical protein n=1 Tax=unclassified Paraburkholderia TaxID=2615204 RepID=UPI002AB130D3|nr:MULTISPECIES: hypothetical protein [unclassified Paraburkholderia]
MQRTRTHTWPSRPPRISSNWVSAGISVVWQPFLWLAVISGVLFAFSLMRFRKTLSRMA